LLLISSEDAVDHFVSESLPSSWGELTQLH
jgi:hypothetical protein